MRSEYFGLMGRKAFGTNRVPRILLYESDAMRIARYTQMTRIETGGDLFGFYEPGGSPIVFVASGPGPAARGDVTHFQQDPLFQTKVFNQLASEFRMFYLGDWHSHHNLGLSEPSGSDDAKLQDLANKNGWPQLVSLIVQTEDARGVSSRWAKKFRNSTTETDGSAGPIEAFGIWWNAFQYRYADKEVLRHRVNLDFQSGNSPYHQIAEKIDVSAGPGPKLNTREQSALGPAFDPHESHTHPTESHNAEGDFTLMLYQKICSILADEVRGAEMEVDLEHSDGPRLILTNGEREVTSRLKRSDTSLQLIVMPMTGEEVMLTVPLTRGTVKAADVKLIAKSIIEQFATRNERTPKDGRR